MYIWLSHEQVKTITAHARNGAPNEVCGLIGGRDGKASDIVPVDNVSAQPDVHYEMHPQQQIDTMLRWQRTGLDLIGIYHSHPHSLPIPSQTDIRDATYPAAAYLIVSLKNPQAELAAWKIAHGEVNRVLLHVGDSPPEPEDVTQITRPQHYALLIAMLLAAVALIGISIQLLPPAPPIPTPGG
ncbi:MAG: M67 family metallopeptidase [Chloroflexota bacterium]